ncbi:MAG: acyl-CoA/acyl-ACP dehydrogenase [Actinomycetota bacterium]|nr:acyl-CoA/acyl-ACP dehydrogenase [Actinomycetota bacterium]
MRTEVGELNFLETPEQTLLRETIAGIASRYGPEYYRGKVKAGEKTTELWDALAAEGYLGVSVPEEYGGGGQGIYELAIVCEELSFAGCPLLLLVVSPAISGMILARFGTDGQKERWLPGLASGREKMVFAITEPNAGSNTHNLETRGTRTAGGWRLDGTKYYISGVDEAEHVLVVARTDTDERSGRARLSLFAVPTDARGLERHEIAVAKAAPEKQFTLFFDGVEVPEDYLIGDEGDGLRQAFYGLNPERITGAASAIGSGRRAAKKAVEYANNRVVWSVPIGAHQGLAHPLAKAYIELELAKLMTQKAAWLYDQGLDAGEATNMANYAAAEAAIACLDQAIQVHGGHGLSEEYGLADMWWGVRLSRTAPVSREMILNYVAQRSLGLPRSY